MSTPITLDTPGTRIFSKLMLCSGRMQESLAQLFSPAELGARYPSLLRCLYHVSRGGDAIMAYAQEQARRRGGPADGPLVNYLERHRAEELGHCEWILDDLEALGFDRREEKGRMPTLETIALMGAGYPWVAREPLTVLGLLAVYEGDPMSVDFLDRAIEASGLPRSAFRFYLDHVRIDIAHGAEVYATIDALVSEPHEEDAVSLCALHHLALTERLADALLAAPASFNLQEVL